MNREEAIKILRETHDKALFSVRTAIETLIPELSESEDERIRKAILAAIRQGLDTEVVLQKYGVTYEDVESYLEKQKESLPIPETCEENGDSFTDEDERVRKEIIEALRPLPSLEETPVGKQHLRWIAYLEKQKEQKDFRKLYEITESEWFKKAYVGKSLGEEDTQKEQKPGDDEWLKKYNDKVNEEIGSSCYNAKDCAKPAEWSAYDKATIEYIIEDIKGLRDEETDEEVIETYNRELNLLQCINDSVKLCNYTNPAEWSEEDEEILNACIEEVGSMHIRGDVQKLRDWLKSLHPRPHWKPSEEQINALEFAKDAYERKDISEPLKQLLLDLKKLLK